MLQYFDANHPGITVDEVLGARGIHPLDLEILPASLPFRVISGPVPFSEVPSALRHEITVSLASAITPFASVLSYHAPTAAVVGKQPHGVVPPRDPGGRGRRGLLRRHPRDASSPAPDDGLPPPGGPPGRYRRLGRPRHSQTLTVEFEDAANRRDRVEHRLSAGGYYAVVLGDGISAEAIRARQQAMSDTLSQETATKDALLGQTLDSLGRNYFAQVAMVSDIAQRTLGVVSTNLGREGLLGAGLSVGTLFGTPVEVGLGGLSIDVQRDVNAPFAKDGDADVERAFMLFTGLNASALEHGIFESFMNTEAVSAVKLMRHANDTGVAIHFIDADNADAVLPTLDLPAADIQAFRDGVNAGKVIYAPEHSLSLGGFEGIGYLILDPETGGGGYIISGGLNGGQAQPDEDTSGFLSELLSFLKNAGLFLAGLLTSVFGVVVNFAFLLFDIVSAYLDGTATLGEAAGAFAVWAALTAISLLIGLPSAGLVLAAAIYGGVLFGAAFGPIIGVIALYLAFVAVQLLIFYLGNYIVGQILSYWIDRRRDQLALARGPDGGGTGGLLPVPA